MVAKINQSAKMLKASRAYRKGFSSVTLKLFNLKPFVDSRYFSNRGLSSLFRNQSS